MRENGETGNRFTTTATTTDNEAIASNRTLPLSGIAVVVNPKKKSGTYIILKTAVKLHVSED